MTRTAVLGAGALGLTVAYRLAQRGDDVVVLEREPIPGGLAAGFEVEPGIWLEKFYHHLFRGDRHAIGLINELGLGDGPGLAPAADGHPARRRGPPARLADVAPALLTRSRSRIGSGWARPSPTCGRSRAPSGLEGQTAAGWIRRRMGAAAYGVVWGPLLRGKFGELAERDRHALVLGPGPRPDRRSSATCAAASSASTTGWRSGSWSWAATCASARRCARSARRDRRSPGDDRGGEALDVDRVVSTLAMRLTCRLAPELPDDYRQRHEWGTAYGAHCLVLALDRPLTSTYWMNVDDPGYPFMALVEHTNYMTPTEYGGRHLVYLGNYRPMDDPLMSASTDAVVDEFTPHLARINPAFERSWVTGAWSFAAPFAQPIVTTEYREHIPPFDTPVPGLWVASMFQVYPHDRGQNYSIDLAERLVSAMSARPSIR